MTHIHSSWLIYIVRDSFALFLTYIYRPWNDPKPQDFEIGIFQGQGAVCCSVLQCVAVCYRVLQCVTVCVAVCCSVLQYVAVCCSMLQCVAVCYSVLQCVAVCVAVCCSMLQYVAVCCSVLQCVAVHCRVLPCIAVYGSVLQCPPGWWQKCKFSKISVQLNSQCNI